MVRAILGQLSTASRTPLAYPAGTSPSFAIVSPYLAYPGWGGRIDSDGVPLIQQAMLGKISPQECLDRFAAVLKQEMT